MYKLFIWDPCIPGRYIAVGLSSGVAVKRGSTVLCFVQFTLSYVIMSCTCTRVLKFH